MRRVVIDAVWWKLNVLYTDKTDKIVKNPGCCSARASYMMCTIYYKYYFSTTPTTKFYIYNVLSTKASETHNDTKYNAKKGKMQAIEPLPLQT